MGRGHPAISGSRSGIAIVLKIVHFREDFRRCRCSDALDGAQQCSLLPQGGMRGKEGLNLGVDGLHLGIQRLDNRLERRLDGGIPAALETIELLGPGFFEGVEMADQRPECLPFRAGRLPQSRGHSLTKIGNHAAIDFIGLVALQLTDGKPFRSGGIDDTDPIPRLKEVFGQRFPRHIGRFHTDMDLLGGLRFHPGMKLPEALRGIRKLPVATWSLRCEDGGIKGFL